MDSRHPLVIVFVIAVIGIGFYYYASPYENCQREYGVKKAFGLAGKFHFYIEKCREQSSW